MDNVVRIGHGKSVRFFNENTRPQRQQAVLRGGQATNKQITQ